MTFEEYKKRYIEHHRFKKVKKLSIISAMLKDRNNTLWDKYDFMFTYDDDYRRNRYFLLDKVENKIVVSDDIRDSLDEFKASIENIDKEIKILNSDKFLRHQYKISQKLGKARNDVNELEQQLCRPPEVHSCRQIYLPIIGVENTEPIEEIPFNGSPLYEQ